MVYCQRCRTANAPERSDCARCGADLLPGISLRGRIAEVVVMLGVAGVLIALGGAGIESGDIAWMVLGGIGVVIGLLMLLGAAMSAVQRTPMHERYLSRARRHTDLDAEQAIRDFASALAALPASYSSAERTKIITEHAELCEKAGHTDEARADLIALVNVLGQKLASALGVDRLATFEERAALYERVGSPDEARADRQSLVEGATQLLSAAKPADREALLKARAAAYERLGYVALGTRDRLDATYASEAWIENKDFGKPGEGAELAAQFLGLDNEAFRVGYSGDKKGNARKQVAAERTILLEAGQIKAIGWCGKCRAAVELHRVLRCSVGAGHGMPKDKDRVFVMPDQAEAAIAQMNEQHNRPHWHLPLSQPHG